MVFKIKPTRSSQVLLEHFGDEHQGGILNVDRYSAYKAIANWSAELAAALFTILHTVKLYHINQHTWLLAYLQACAENQGRPPEEFSSFLPWKMGNERKQLFSQPPIHEPPMVTD